LGLCGLVSGQEVTDQEMTFDGMVPEKKGLLKLSWVDPDIDFSVYTKVIPGEAYFEFRAVKKSSGLAARSSNKREFWISDKDKQKLIDTVSDIFEEEIAKSKHFTVVEEPGPDTLIIRGGLLDIISKVPPDLMGSGQIYLTSVAEATLVIEVVDSLSGEVIYRAVERRAAQRPGQTAMSAIPANTVTTWAEVKRWAQRWGRKLREGLDAIHE